MNVMTGWKPPAAFIEVQRGAGWIDRLRSWRVLIDGEPAGRVKQRETTSLTVSPGPHLVQLKIGLSGSRPLRVDLRQGERVVLACRPYRWSLWPGAMAPNSTSVRGPLLSVRSGLERVA